MSEKNCHFVSSRGILHACDIKSDIPVSSIRQLYHYDWTNLREGSVLYICNSAIPIFSTIIDQLPCKIILVSGDADESCPMELFPTGADFKLFVENERIIHWFSQNLIVSHYKMTNIPIGLDYHTMTISNIWGESVSPLEQEKTLLNIRNHALPFYERKMKIYANFHFALNTKFAKDRIDAMSQIPKDLVFYELSRLERNETWQNQSEYTFVASPHGNGLDCHRTWEALCLGCIVIVKTSPLNNLYDGLPVLIVEEWSCITEQVLLETIENCKKMEFQYEKLTLEYWMDMVFDKKR
jgi:hypothetical protein